MIDEKKLDKELQKFLDEIKIDKIHIDDIIADYPYKKARYIIALNRTKNKLLKKEFELKKLYYDIYLQLREENKTKRITEENLKAMIITNEDYVALKNEVIELQKKVNMLEGLVSIWNDLGRMLYLIKEGAKNEVF